MLEALAPLLTPEQRLIFPVVALGLMALDYLSARLAGLESHDAKESAASLAIMLGGALVKAGLAGVVAAPFLLAHQFRLFDIGMTGWAAWAALFLGVEFCYYWMHRASHRVRWLWATHSVHHTPTRLNLTAAVRLGWTGPLSGAPFFFLPLVVIGFPPVAVIALLAVNLVYQFFLHTERAVRLGPLEWVLNTPAHHQVHHASNANCLDRNYGGVLIIFDRLFGTFAVAPAGEALRYGVLGGETTSNPLRIVFGEWLRMARDAWTASGWRARLRALFGAP